ncbi:MAG: DNA replication/repair protein RecF [Peptoniphilus sp.]|nr:DNA replication/repair protein RecF [Peptoniphilus sp.]MDY3118300.1 DNA replication/repair protein RecF [Peptoniphilus sp.]
MFVRQLHIVSFRNHDRLSIDLEPRIYRMIGPNGTGKTNFLEAIYFAMTGRSFKTTALKELISFGKDEAYAAAKVDIGDFTHDMEISLRQNKRRLLRDHNPVKNTSAYSRGMGVVLFEPAHLQMVQGSPSERRRFMDDMLRMTSTSYEEAYTSYYHVLYQRNVVLRKLNDGNLLDVYDLSLARYASVILKERLRFLKRMAPSVCNYYKVISDEKEVLQVRYKASFPVALDDGLEEAFYDSLKARRSVDRERGRTGIGPHLDDLSFLLDGEEAKKFASTGQIRSIVLAMKCMEIDRVEEHIGSAPVILLDDVFSELDERRRSLLLKMIGGQCFITAAEPVRALEECTEAIDLINRKKHIETVSEEDLW